jgi:hypothetical protein
VVLLEAVSIGSGVTGNTSAKVSALQGTTLSTIASRHGSDVAAVYAAASASAVTDVAALAADEQIDCGLERRPAVTYASNPEELGQLHLRLSRGRILTAGGEAQMPLDLHRARHARGTGRHRP